MSVGKGVQWGVSLILMTAAGCRSATQVVRVPRVDLERGGNQGFLMGTPPPSEPQKTTREMVETTVEVPSWYKPTQGRVGIGPTGQVELGEVAPPEVDLSEEGRLEMTPVPSESDMASSQTYVTKPGDTLWSIAAQSSVFGDATKWRRLYEANRDILKSPDQLRAGMTLRIPRASQETQQTTEPAGTWTK